MTNNSLLKDKLKILHYIPVYAPAWKYGGPILSTSQLCEELVKLGHDVEVFTTNCGQDESLINKNLTIKRNGVKVTYFDYQYFLGIHSKDLRETINYRIREFDLVHISGIWQPSSYYVASSAKKNRIPYVISTRGALGPYSWRRNSAKKIFYYLLREKFNIKNSSMIHYTTSQEKNECVWLNLQNKSCVIPNGLDLNFWKYDKNKGTLWRNSNKINEDEFVFLNVGRLHHKKGLDILPKCFNKLKGKPWKLVFIGNEDDNTKSNIIKKCKSFDILRNIIFLPSTTPSELIGAYSGANLFLLPSLHENFGNVVVESMACGCPVLISNKVGLHRELEHLKFSWVIDRNPNAWADQLNQLMANKFSNKLIRKSLTKFIEENYSIKITSSKMETIYKEILYNS